MYLQGVFSMNIYDAIAKQYSARIASEKSYDKDMIIY